MQYLIWCVIPNTNECRKINSRQYCVFHPCYCFWWTLDGTGTFRAQDLSFPRTNSPYGELSFPILFVPGNFRSLGTKVPWNFRSRALSFSGTFVPRTFRSQELSFLRLFYNALAMNVDSYSNCQNLFRSTPKALGRPSSVCFPKINWVSLKGHSGAD